MTDPIRTRARSAEAGWIVTALEVAQLRRDLAELADLADRLASALFHLMVDFPDDLDAVSAVLADYRSYQTRRETP